MNTAPNKKGFKKNSESIPMGRQAFLRRFGFYIYLPNRFFLFQHFRRFFLFFAIFR